MLKPVSILALDDAAATLAEGVARRISAALALDDLVQFRAIAPGADLGAAIESVHARRQAPESPIRARDDVSSRELVLLIVSATSEAAKSVVETAAGVRRLYDMRRLAEFYAIEILCLLPDLFASDPPAAYGDAYSLLKMASAADPAPFNAMWLLSSQNANRVKFGPLAQSFDAYVEAVAGALMYEPELSGAMPGAFRPRGMDATFSSFGFAELVFPREAALRRLEPRLASELLRARLLAAGPAESAPQLAAKQFVAGEGFAVPLSRIGVDAGQSLFKRFHARTLVGEQTRTAEEVIAAVRAELAAHRDGIHVANLQALAAQGEKTSKDFAALLSHVVDETLDSHDYATAAAFLDALLDPLPDLRADAGVAPRSLVTEINVATAALDARVRFTPNTAASDAMRKQIRELDTLLQDQKLVAETLAPLNAGEQLAAMEGERDDLARQLPDLLFAEEGENNAGRNASRDAEAARLAQETEAKEQHLRELFAARPRAEQALREALEERRAYIRRQICWAALAVVAIYGVPFAFGRLQGNVRSLTWSAVIVVAVLAGYSLLRYVAGIGARLRLARENLEQIQAHINATDKAKNSAHNDELQFEYDVAHRRTTLAVLRRTREAAKAALDAIRTRMTELEELAESFAPESITSAGLSIAIIDDDDVDAWYERTADDRKPLFREFPIRRSESRHLAMSDLRRRIEAHAASGFGAFAKLTLAQAFALPPEAKAAQRLKRFADYAAPLIDVRDDDIEAERAMQRDTTLWIEASDRGLLDRVRRRLPAANMKPPRDPLRIHALSRVLHYPAYVLGQIEYYRAQYDPAAHSDSAATPDLLPMPAAVRDAYEQVLLARAVGVIRLQEDGQLGHASGDAVLGDSNLTAALRLASADALRQELEREIAPRLSIAGDVERDLRQFMASEQPLSEFDRGVMSALMKRYGLMP